MTNERNESKQRIVDIKSFFSDNEELEPDNNPKYYIFSNTYENIDNFEMKKYVNCIYKYDCLINITEKKYRQILLEDVKKFEDKQEELLKYENKIVGYCKIGGLGFLLFLNENAFLPITFGALSKLDIIREDVSNMYFERKGNSIQTKSNIVKYYSFDEEYIYNSLHDLFMEIVCNHFKYIDDNEKKKEIDKFESMNNNILFKIYNIDYLALYFDQIINKVMPEIISFDEIYKELTKYREVNKNLKNSFWLGYEYSQRESSQDEYIQGEDFSFLILNSIKAFEFYLYKKLEKNIDEREDVSEKIMLDSMIKKIDYSMLKEDLKNYVTIEMFEKYKEHLFYVKDNCRNGYFHKHRMDSLNDLLDKNSFVYKTLIETAILLK